MRSTYFTSAAIPGSVEPAMATVKKSTIPRSATATASGGISPASISTMNSAMTRLTSLVPRAGVVNMNSCSPWRRRLRPGQAECSKISFMTGYKSRSNMLRIELQEGGWLRCILDRPEALNALHPDQLSELTLAVNHGAADPAVNIVTVEGA